MSDQPVVLAVATYLSRAAAEQDYRAVCGLKREGGLGHAGAAVLEKGADGTLEIVRHDGTAKLLGGAITVLAAPLGIAFLAPRAATSAEWAGVSLIVGHFWHNVPRDQLRRMSDLLEAGQTALIVVAVDPDGGNIAALLSNGTTTLVSDSTRADFEADLAKTGPRRPKPLSES